MKKYTLILFPFLCFLNFYLFGGNEGIYLNFPSNTSVIQSHTIERNFSTSGESFSQNCTIDSQIKVRPGRSERSKELEVTNSRLPTK